MFDLRANGQMVCFPSPLLEAPSISANMLPQTWMKDSPLARDRSHDRP
jgi:hypothetical protein